jgi:hypothetical protein
MNLDYKYVSGSTDIFEIINKYRMRGFGTWLNPNEYKMMEKYCNTIPKWKMIFKKQIIYGCLSIANNIFKKSSDQSKYKPEIISEETFNTHVQGFPGLFSYSDILRMRFPNILSHPIYDKLTVIDKDGYVTPLKKWVINRAFDLITQPV